MLALDPRLANALGPNNGWAGEQDDPFGRTGYTCPVATLVETLVWGSSQHQPVRHSAGICEFHVAWDGRPWFLL